MPTNPSSLAPCARRSVLTTVRWCAACCHGGGCIQEPTSDIIVELCLRVALLDEPQYQPTSIDPLSQPRVQKCREPSATALPPMTAAGKISELGVVDGHHVAAVEQLSTPAHVPVTAAATLHQADPCALRPQATERKQDYMRSPNGSTPETQAAASPSPMSPSCGRCDANTKCPRHGCGRSCQAQINAGSSG